MAKDFDEEAALAKLVIELYLKSDLQKNLSQNPIVLF